MTWSTILRIGLAVVLVVAFVAGLIFLPTPHYVMRLLEWIQGLGAWGAVLLIVVYALVCLLCLWASLLTLAAGFMYGVVWGTIAACLGATLGATIAFVLARTVLRGWIEHRLTTHPKFLAIDHAIGESGFQVVLLTRLCSLFPFNLMSYVFGLTNVSLGRYVPATLLGRIPETLAFAYVGWTAKSLADLAAGKVAFGIEQEVLLGLGLLAMVAAAAVIARIARKALRETVDKPNPPEMPAAGGTGS
jgi:uncharacterized membrane protein YdjX (TVP38/TMEM64 family)